LIKYGTVTPIGPTVPSKRQNIEFLKKIQDGGGCRLENQKTLPIQRTLDPEDISSPCSK